jgi:hypothetical protein
MDTNEFIQMIKELVSTDMPNHVTMEIISSVIDEIEDRE